MAFVIQQTTLDSRIFIFFAPLLFHDSSFTNCSFSSLFLPLQVFLLDINRTIILGTLYLPFSIHWNVFLCIQYSKVLLTDVTPKLILVRHMSGSLSHYALMVSRMSLLCFCLLACFDS
jgi:hypothetical protein